VVGERTMMTIPVEAKLLRLKMIFTPASLSGTSWADCVAGGTARQDSVTLPLISQGGRLCSLASCLPFWQLHYAC
jgi:hypothetical protein